MTKRQPAKSKRTAGSKMTAMKKSAKAKKKLAKKKSARKKAPGKSQSVNRAAFPGARRASGSGRQSGDLQGISRIKSADSESVDELLEEGNAFEAGAVKGVEDADDSDEKEVYTHEVPEDDVPEEYLEKE